MNSLTNLVHFESKLRKANKNKSFLEVSRLFVAQRYAISFDKTVFPIPGTPSISIIFGVKVNPSELVLAANKLAIFFVVFLYNSFDFSFKLCVESPVETSDTKLPFIASCFVTVNIFVSVGLSLWWTRAKVV